MAPSYSHRWLFLTSFIFKVQVESVSDKIRETCAVEGLTNLLRWMSEQRLPLSSIVTSRSRRIAEVLRSMEPELGPVRHLYHASHFVEWLEQHLKKVCTIISSFLVLWFAQFSRTSVKLPHDFTLSFFSCVFAHVNVTCNKYQYKCQQFPTRPLWSCEASIKAHR